MTCYIVSFEPSTSAARQAITNKIKAYGFYCPINKNCWALMTDQSAAQVRDSLAAALPQADMLFVIRSGTEAAWRNTYGEKHTAWLKENL